MNSDTLHRITTRYEAHEDRVRLSGEKEDGRTVRLWLTQRLCLRLLPPLLHWLETQAGDLPAAEAWQGLSQQAARAALSPGEPVQDDAADHWLVDAVDVTTQAAGVKLRLRCGEQVCGELTLAATPLRQWLGILHDQWRRAEWPASAWPAWFTPTAVPEGTAWLH